MVNDGQLAKWRGAGKRFFGFHGLLVLELFLLAGCLFQYLTPLHRYSYQGKDLTSEYCSYQTDSEDNSLGCLVDEAVIPEDVEAKYVYITTPPVNLKRGTYRVTFHYSTDDPDQRYSFSSKLRESSVIVEHDMRRMPMNAGSMERCFSSATRVEDFVVHVNYSGNGYMLVKGITISETNGWKNMQLLFVLLSFLIIDGFILYFRGLSQEARRKARVTCAVLTGAALFASLPFMGFYLPEGDDLLFHLNRIEAIQCSLLQGQFPNRVSSYWNHGYGYASAVLYGEAFLYVPALLRILGFSVRGAYKIYVVLVNLATALAAWYSFRKVFKNDAAALFGCVLYVLAPYRLVCIYMRAAVGEYTAMVFFPLIFCGLMQIFFGDTQKASYKKDAFIPLVIGLTGMIQSHVISCVIVAGFAGLFSLLFIKRLFHMPRFMQMLKAAVWTVALNFWFLLPFLDYMRLGYAGRPVEINDLGRMPTHGAFPSQMLTMFQRGYANAFTTIEGIGCTDERNYALGGFFLVALVYFFYRLYQGKAKSEIEKTGDCCLAFALLAGFMCTTWFPWIVLQEMNGLFRMVIRNIQFPWRFMGACCFFLTLTAICLYCLLESAQDKRFFAPVIVAVGALSFVSSDYYMYDYTQSVELHRYDDAFNLDDTAVGGGEYLMKDTPPDFVSSVESLPGEGVEVFDEQNTDRGHIVSCRNRGDDAQVIDLPILPYRGYVCCDADTGEELEVQLSVPGRLRVVLPGGYEGTLCAHYEEPWYWRLSEAVSAAALILAVAGKLTGFMRKRKGLKA